MIITEAVFLCVMRAFFKLLPCLGGCSFFFFLRVMAKIKFYQFKQNDILEIKIWLTKGLFFHSKNCSAMNISRYKEGMRMSFRL